jgi:predicted short-subunit dehydrogenase-like oxidoreductase (DUF2520 family)
MSKSIGFIGAGAVSNALARVLSDLGYRVVAVNSKRGDSARVLADSIESCQALATSQEVADACDLIFIAVPDMLISSVVSQIKWRVDQSVIHCSGALTLEPLDRAYQEGAMVGSFHPLQTFHRHDSHISAGVAVAIEADGQLSSFLHDLAHHIGGLPIQISPQDRPIYHAAAVLSCGYVATLIKLAGDLWNTLGIKDIHPLTALGPLVRGTLDAILIHGTSSATGPVIRGDVETVRHHLEALSQRMPEIVNVYCHLGLASLSMARVSGNMTDDTLQDFEELFSKHLSKDRSVGLSPV